MSTPSWLQGAVSENLGLKFMSVLLASCVWLYVNSRGHVTVNFAVPITPVGLGANMVLTAIDNDTADVRLSGRDSALPGVSSRHIRVTVNLADQDPGNHWINLGPDDVSGPERLEVTRVNPRQVRVTLEQRLERSLKVVAELTGDPAAGFVVSAISVEPPMVQLEGGSSALTDLTLLRTQPIPLDGLDHSLRREARLDLGGRQVTVIDPVPVYVTIEVKKVASGSRSGTPLKTPNIMDNADTQ